MRKITPKEFITLYNKGKPITEMKDIIKENGKISMCLNCHCMTKNICGKCGLEQYKQTISKEFQEQEKIIIEIITAYLCDYACKKDKKIRLYREGILKELKGKSKIFKQKLGLEK